MAGAYLLKSGVTWYYWYYGCLLALANHPVLRSLPAATSWAFPACSLCAFDVNDNHILCFIGQHEM